MLSAPPDRFIRAGGDGARAVGLSNQHELNAMVEGNWSDSPVMVLTPGRLVSYVLARLKIDGHRE